MGVNAFCQRHLKEVRTTIKLEDIEERYDIYFSRFIGLFFAKWADRLHLHPNHVSLLSLISGVAGGALLYFQTDLTLVILAGLLITLSGILDSADGQLARISGRSSEVGRIIDGSIDTLVFFSFYIFGTAYFYNELGYPIIILSLLSIYFHGVKSAIYEFYKSEYLRFVGKSTIGHIPMSVKEVRIMGTSPYHYGMHILNWMLVNAQLTYVTRKKGIRSRMIELENDDPTKFAEKYQHLNKSMMPWWAWICGLNVHRNGIVFFSLLGRFDFFLYASLVWTIWLIPMSLVQRKRDRKLLLEMER